MSLSMLSMGHAIAIAKHGYGYGTQRLRLLSRVVSNNVNVNVRLNSNSNSRRCLSYSNSYINSVRNRFSIVTPNSNRPTGRHLSSLQLHYQQHHSNRPNRQCEGKRKGQSQRRSMVNVTITRTKTGDDNNIGTPEPASASASLLNQIPAADENSNAQVEPPQVQQNIDSLLITASAVRQIHQLALLKRPHDPSQAYLRVYVDAGGCSGFQYKFEIGYLDIVSDGSDGSSEEMDMDMIDPEEDIVINASLSLNENEKDDEDTNVKVVIDETSLEYLKGSKVDFVRELIKSSFAIVENPQSESACGCGSSFAVKNFGANPALD